MKKIWITKEGKEIPYNKITDKHLINILDFINKISEKKIKCKRKEYFDCGYDGDSYIPDFVWVEGTATKKEILEHFDYKSIKNEAKRRNLQFNLKS